MWTCPQVCIPKYEILDGVKEYLINALIGQLLWLTMNAYTNEISELNVMIEKLACCSG